MTPESKTSAPAPMGMAVLGGESWSTIQTYSTSPAEADGGGRLETGSDVLEWTPGAAPDTSSAAPVNAGFSVAVYDRSNMAETLVTQVAIGDDVPPELDPLDNDARYFWAAASIGLAAAHVPQRILPHPKFGNSMWSFLDRNGGGLALERLMATCLLADPDHLVSYALCSVMGAESGQIETMAAPHPAGERQPYAFLLAEILAVGLPDGSTLYTPVNCC